MIGLLQNAYLLSSLISSSKKYLMKAVQAYSGQAHSPRMGETVAIIRSELRGIKLTASFLLFRNYYR